MARLQLNNLEKVYGGAFKAVHGINLDVEEGEFMVLVGPSGCAKSTTLRMIAGLEDITAGEIRIGDRIVNTLEPVVVLRWGENAVVLPQVEAASGAKYASDA